jgi:hypothetical protein
LLSLLLKNMEAIYSNLSKSLSTQPNAIESLSTIDRKSVAMLANSLLSSGNVWGRSSDLLHLLKGDYQWDSSFENGSLSADKLVKSVANPGNAIIGNGKWIISKDTTQESFASQFSSDNTKLVDKIFDRLRRRLPKDELSKASDSGNGSNPFTGDNPFANGKNPFGEGDFSPPPGYNLLESKGGENFPLPSSDINNTINSTENSNQLISESSNNPFGNFSNQSGSNSSNQQPSFDVVNLLLGNNSSFPSTENQLGDADAITAPNSEVMQGVLNGIKGATDAINAGNIFAAGNPTPLETPSDLLRLFQNDMFSFNNSANAFKDLLGDSNPFEGNDLFGGENSNNQIPFDILNVVLDGLLPFNGSENIFQTEEGELPIGYGNRDFGYESATIGNANWSYGSKNATIGNGNWNWDGSSKNVTLGNGNWLWDDTKNNTTIGNGNWYWDESSDNSTLGNGNWNFGSDNTTIGNGNWDFGNNNIVIGNGNKVFTNNSIVIGNGNWSVVIDKSTVGNDFLTQLNTLGSGLEVKDAANNLIDTILHKMGEAFLPLTTDLDSTASETYNRLFLDNSVIST